MAAISDDEIYGVSFTISTFSISKFNSSGEEWRVIGTTSKPLSACVMTIDVASENILIALPTDATISINGTTLASTARLFYLQMTPSGKVLEFVSIPATNAYVPNNIGMAFDSDGSLFVSVFAQPNEQGGPYSVGSVSILSGTTIIKLMNGTVQLLPKMSVPQPSYLSFDEAGNIYAYGYNSGNAFSFGSFSVSSLNRYLVKFGPSGTLLWGVSIGIQTTPLPKTFAYVNGSLFLLALFESESSLACGAGMGICLVRIRSADGSLVASTKLFGASNVALSASSTNYILLGQILGSFRFANVSIAPSFNFNSFIATFSYESQISNACVISNPVGDQILTFGKRNRLYMYSDNSVLSICNICKKGTVFNQTINVCSSCAAGTFNSQLNNTACQKCSAGYYQNQIESEFCIPCSAGTVSDKLGMTSCDACPIGRYSPISGQITCQNCTSGWFNNLIGASSCTSCTPGYFSGDQASYCSPCSPGSFSNQMNATNCEMCPPSQFNTAHASSRCIVCPSGSASSVSRTICEECKRGWYLSQNDGFCVQCAAGSYNNRTGQSQCLLCAPGNYTDVPASLECKPCVDGQYSSTFGAVSCLTCPRGQVSRKSSCVPCGSGTVPNEQQSACVACPFGTFASTIYHACTSCFPGYYMDAQGASACKACPKGEFTASVGSVNCTNCKAGSISDVEGSFICKTCPPGFIPNTYRNECIVCELGHVSNGTHCILCPAGTYTLQSVCAACPQGFYSAVGASFCLLCPLGTISENGTVCKPCLAGYYNNERGAQACKRCEAGFYSIPAAETCNKCDYGQISSAAATECSKCAVGTKSNENRTHCDLCISGTFNNEVGSSSCQKCQIGYISSNGAAICTPCDAGFYSNNERTACLSCQPGSYNPNKGGVCVPPPEGMIIATFGAATLQTAIRCDTGTMPSDLKTSCIDCTMSTFNADIGSICKKCDIGTITNVTKAVSCISCSKGYASNFNRTECHLCAVGFFAENPTDACQKCPESQTSNAQHTSCIPVCDEETYLDSEQNACIKDQRLDQLKIILPSVGSALLVLVAMAIAILVCCCCVIARRKKSDDEILLDLLEHTDDNTSSIELMSIEMPIIKFDELTNLKEIGTGGSSAIILRATWNSKAVVLKLFKFSGDSQDAFIHELNLLSYVYQRFALTWLANCATRALFTSMVHA